MSGFRKSSIIFIGLSIVVVCVSGCGTTTAYRKPVDKDLLQKEVNKYIGLLDSEDPEEQVHAISELAQLETKAASAVNELIKVLKDENPAVRMSAAFALGKIRQISAITPLINALDDSNSIVRVHAAWALNNITGKDFGQNQQIWRDWWQENKDRF